MSRAGAVPPVSRVGRRRQEGRVPGHRRHPSSPVHLGRGGSAVHSGVGVLRLVTVTVTVEAPRDLPHTRGDHLGGPPDARRHPSVAPCRGPEGLAVHLGQAEVGIVGEEEVPVEVPRRVQSRCRVEQSLAQQLLLLLEDQAAGTLPGQLYLGKLHVDSFAVSAKCQRMN